MCQVWTPSRCQASNKKNVSKDVSQIAAATGSMREGLSGVWEPLQKAQTHFALSNIPNATFVRFAFAVSKHPECHVARSSLALSNVPNAILCEIFSCTLKKTNMCSIVATTQRKSCVSTCDTMTVALCWCTQAASTGCGSLLSKRSAIVEPRASAAALTPNSLKGCGSSNGVGKMVVRKTWCQLITGHALSNRMKKREKKKIVLRRRFPCKNQWNVTMPETSFYTLLRNEKRSFPKQCYKTSKQCSFGCSPLLGTPTCSNSRIPRILATYTYTITLCLGSHYLGSPQPTSFAAATSKSSNSLGWTELDT